MQSFPSPVSAPRRASRARSTDRDRSALAVLVAVLGLAALTWPRVAGATNAQTPIVTSIEPTSIVEDGASFTLTVHGSGFFAPVLGPVPSPGTVVRFAASGLASPEALPTTFVSSTELQVLVPGSDTSLTRQTLAQQTILGQLSEQGITAFLNATGGVFCSFADVTCPPAGMVTDTTGVAGGWRYIETLFRLGYTGNACSPPSSVVRLFCPTASANVLGTVGVFGIDAANRELQLPLPSGLFVSAPPVPFSVVAPTPTPPPAPAIPTLSQGGLIGLLALLAVAAIVTLRARHGS